MSFRFCPECGGGLAERLVEGESRPRLVCDGCGFIFYLNPKVTAAALPIKDGRVFLVRRGIEPRKGAWTFPSGFVELGETVEEAALRETREETNLQAELRDLLNVYSKAGLGIITVVYLARVVGGEPALGPETLEIASFAPQEIPWEELAFDSTRMALREWVRGAAELPSGRSAAGPRQRPAPPGA